ncbi:MAG: hypothetical protein H6993_18080 [Pseudomonadales bacterium]|nr:hypothetical protein [Pseudomonadales bacterium]MCP5185879.1 hypothetical protein [Pseudomonadales bacterium]
MIANEEPNISDYLQVLKRRRLLFITTGSLVLLAAVLLAFLLPPRFRSEATLLIERQTIPYGLVKSTVTGFVQERIQQITQEILTYDNLLKLSRKHELYTDELATVPGEVARKMRKDFAVEMLDVKATDPNEAGERRAAIAFTVAFYADNPKTARDVTQELAERYLEENEKQRREQAQKVRSFLEEEANKLSQEIEALEARIAQFKTSELNSLPEVAALNRSLYEKTEEQIDRTRDRIRELESRVEATGGELAVTPMFNDVRTEEGQVILSSQDRMNSLVAQYLRATSRYSAKHPDVIRLSREIRALAEQTGSAGRTDELMEELIRQQEALRQAQQKYGPDHPDVKRLQSSVASLEGGFQKALTTASEEQAASQPDNPRYVSLQSQLSGFQSSLSAERAKLIRYENKLEEYESRLNSSPLVESEYSNLTREMQSKTMKYNELKNKIIEARFAQQLESSETGERFSLTSPAFLPSLPDSPNRIGILILGVLLAGLLAVVAIAVAEFFDDAIHDSRAVTNLFGTPPLVVIPKF